MDPGEPRTLTPFQIRCGREVAQVFRGRTITFRREQIDGEGESYLLFTVGAKSGPSLRIYVYEDEAGFFLDDEWQIWETPDFDESSELLGSFLEGLRTALQTTGLTRPPE